jgi:cysteinyl-tRNA synthetase
MSKSLGNFFTVREILENYRPEEVRYFILTSHYRSPLNYDSEHLDNARAALTRFYTALRGLPDSEPNPDLDVADSDIGSGYRQRFEQAMNDDFNTPVALSVLFDLVREINSVKQTDTARASKLAALLKQLSSVLGLLTDDPENFFKGQQADGLIDNEIDRLVKQRVEAKANKDWATADRIRDELKEQGVVVEDNATGSTWRRS